MSLNYMSSRDDDEMSVALVFMHLAPLGESRKAKGEIEVFGNESGPDQD